MKLSTLDSVLGKYLATSSAVEPGQEVHLILDGFYEGRFGRAETRSVLKQDEVLFGLRFICIMSIFVSVKRWYIGYRQCGGHVYHV